MVLRRKLQLVLYFDPEVGLKHLSRHPPWLNVGWGGSVINHFIIFELFLIIQINNFTHTFFFVLWFWGENFNLSYILIRKLVWSVGYNIGKMILGNLPWKHLKHDLNQNLYATFPQTSILCLGHQTSKTKWLLGHATFRLWHLLIHRLKFTSRFQK